MGPTAEVILKSTGRAATAARAERAGRRRFSLEGMPWAQAEWPAQVGRARGEQPVNLPHPKPGGATPLRRGARDPTLGAYLEIRASRPAFPRRLAAAKARLKPTSSSAGLEGIRVDPVDSTVGANEQSPGGQPAPADSGDSGSAKLPQTIPGQYSARTRSNGWGQKVGPDLRGIRDLETIIARNPMGCPRCRRSKDPKRDGHTGRGSILGPQAPCLGGPWLRSILSLTHIGIENGT